VRHHDGEALQRLEISVGHPCDSATDVLIKANQLHDNGWKDPRKRHRYGLDVANSSAVTVRTMSSPTTATRLSSSSSTVSVENNVFRDNGREQFPFIHADNNTIQGNEATGGTQGLEMRFRAGTRSPTTCGRPAAQYLENDNHDNTFLYERSKARRGGRREHGQSVRASSFSNPAVHDGHHPEHRVRLQELLWALHWDVVGNALVTLDRSVNTLPKVSKAVTVRFPVARRTSISTERDSADRPTILAAMGSVIGGSGWEAGSRPRPRRQRGRG
jgi:hypothetical protein